MWISKRMNSLNLAAGALATGLLLAILSASAAAQTSVFVPGNATGSFGNPTSGSVPFVPALTVAESGTIVVSYVSGTVTDNPGVDTGPDGVPFNNIGAQMPLQEAVGVSGGKSRTTML